MTIPSEQPSPNPIEQIKKLVVDRCNAAPFFANLKVIHDEKGDVAQQVEIAVTSIGLSVVFSMIKGKVKYANLGSFCMEMIPTFTIEEAPLLNRDPKNAASSGKIATDVVVEIFQLFHPHTPGGSPISLKDWDLIGDSGGRIKYQIVGTMKANLTSKTGEAP